MGPVNPRHEKVNRKETARPRIDAMSKLSAILEILNDEKDEPEENRDPETQLQRTCLAALDGGHAHRRCFKAGELLAPCNVFHPRSFLPCRVALRLSPGPQSARWSLDVVKRCQMLGGGPPPLPGGAPVPVEQPAGDGTDNDIRHRDEKKEARVEARPCIGAHRRTPTDGTRVPRRRDQQ